MPTLRDLVHTLHQRDGVEAAVVLGRDGLVIEAEAAAGMDAESLAALTPALVGAGEEVGAHIAGAGALTTCVLEYTGRVAVACVLSPDAILMVLAGPAADVPSLLFDLRRNLGRMASLV